MTQSQGISAISTYKHIQSDTVVQTVDIKYIYQKSLYNKRPVKQKNLIKWLQEHLLSIIRIYYWPLIIPCST